MTQINPESPLLDGVIQSLAMELSSQLVELKTQKHDLAHVAIKYFDPEMFEGLHVLSGIVSYSGESSEKRMVVERHTAMSNTVAPHRNHLICKVIEIAEGGLSVIHYLPGIPRDQDSIKNSLIGHLVTFNMLSSNMLGSQEKNLEARNVWSQNPFFDPVLNEAWMIQTAAH